MTVKTIFPFVLFPILILLFFLVFPSSLVFALPMIILGYLFWNMFEYVFHRFAFHNRTLPKGMKRYLSNGHRFHHRYPQNTENFILPVGLTLPFSLLSVLLVSSIFGTTNLGWYYTGLILGLFSYEFMHYASHHFDIKLSFFSFMKEYHHKHHFEQTHSNYMVSNPMFDYLFTRKIPESGKN